MLTGNILINPIGFNSTGINTTTNTITINSHNLKTGDKVLYSANLVASGLTTDFYYVSRVDDNNIKPSKTLIDNKTTLTLRTKKKCQSPKKIKKLKFKKYLTQLILFF